MDNKKNNGIIGLLIGIIIMLLVLVCLFATNTISFNSKTTSNDNKTTNTEENNTNEENNNIDEEKYSKIIEEYKTAMKDTEYNNSTNTEEKYPNINTTMMRYYHNNLNIEFKYTYYDINKDNKNELIVGNGYNIFEIYTHNGITPQRFFNSVCLNERCEATIYDNGIICFYGSGGARVHGLDFYKIANDSYSKENIKSYTVEYDESNNVTITDEITKTKTNYKNDEEIITSIVGNANKIDLTKLNWKEIK